MDKGFTGDFKIFGKYYKKNPFRFELVNEIDKQACLTYQENFNFIPINDDIKNIKITKKVDVVLGGFPCQDFSIAGKMKGLKTERGNLYLEMIRVIKESKPKLFIAENVQNMVKLEKGKVFEKIIEDFSKLDYNVYHKIYDMSDYGIPQTRKRIIIYGIEKKMIFLEKK